jgi:hypothetical protein
VFDTGACQDRGTRKRSGVVVAAIGGELSTGEGIVLGDVGIHNWRNRAESHDCDRYSGRE